MTLTQSFLLHNRKPRTRQSTIPNPNFHNTTSYYRKLFAKQENKISLKQIVFKGETVNTLEEYIDEDDKEILSVFKNALPGYFAYGCDSLKSITIPKNVKIIYKNAFYGCENLTSVKFAGAVNNIGKSAFSKCVNLKTVNFTKGYFKKVYDL